MTCLLIICIVRFLGPDRRKPIRKGRCTSRAGGRRRISDAVQDGLGDYVGTYLKLKHQWRLAGGKRKLKYMRGERRFKGRRISISITEREGRWSAHFSFDTFRNEPSTLRHVLDFVIVIMEILSGTVTYTYMRPVTHTCNLCVNVVVIVLSTFMIAFLRMHEAKAGKV